MERTSLLFVFGLVVLGIGLFMPATSIHHESVCMKQIPGVADSCYVGYWQDVEVEKPNELKWPVTVGGAVLAIAGAAMPRVEKDS